MINSQMGKPVKSVWDYADAYDPKHQSCYFWLSTTSWDQTSVMQGHLYVYEPLIVDLNSDHVDLMNPLAHWKYTTTPEISETAPGYLTNVNACEIDGELVCITFDKLRLWSSSDLTWTVAESAIAVDNRQRRRRPHWRASR